MPVARVPEAKVALSTASVYPESTSVAFELAEKLGYDGVEVMVWNDPISQDIEALRRLSDAHRMPTILAVHAPCLLITQRVWTTDPWTKLVRARAAAEKLGARSAVVVHPPFRWQRQYARDFVKGIGRMEGETDVRFAVENMYPLALPRPAVSPRTPPAGDQSRRRSTGTSPSTCRTRRCPSPTPSRWPGRSTTGSATSTWPTASARRATSTWCRAGATSRARSCWNASPSGRTRASS